MTILFRQPGFQQTDFRAGIQVYYFFCFFEEKSQAALQNPPLKAGIPESSLIL